MLAEGVLVLSFHVPKLEKRSGAQGGERGGGPGLQEKKELPIDPRRRGTSSSWRGSLRAAEKKRFFNWTDRAGLSGDRQTRELEVDRASQPREEVGYLEARTERLDEADEVICRILVEQRNRARERVRELEGSIVR